ncbi:MAG: response regulator [Alphaproteobacteria bacterium]|nr:response regulator [Alphaproteobacteria bacterium]
MPKAYNFERMIVLLVDDNRHMRTTISAMLRGFGVRQIVDANDGSEALRELRAAAYDVCICDWNMSPLDGIDFTRLVRTASDSPNPFLPIIMLTGYTEMARIVEARDAGVTEFLAKPLSPKNLLLRLIEVVERPRQFIKTKAYFGPDRRRHKDSNYTGAERRKGGAATPAPAAAMSQEEVEALMNS